MRNPLARRLGDAKAENARLTAALEQIAGKSDPERPKKWDNEQDTSYGITIGLWRAGQIAREALAAADSGNGEAG